MTQQLDPSPHNELGKGILDPEVEQKLLAEGCTYARRVFGGGFYRTEDGQRYFFRTAKTPINAIATNLFAGLVKMSIRYGTDQKATEAGANTVRLFV